MQLAFVTCVKESNLTEDDNVLKDYLSKRNIVVIPVVWDDATIDWQQFDAIVLRSMWDYFERPLEFNKWLDKLETLGCNVLNPISVVKWNQNKNYFNVFSRKGIPLPPYVICSQSSGELKGIMDNNGWSKAVIKPTISGGAYNTWIAAIENASVDEQRFAKLLKLGNVIVQQFVEEILTKGELSMVFFNKRYSHAIIKRAKQGDFRVQTQFGGTVEAIQPNKAILKQAKDLIDSIEEPLLYARVDGVVIDESKFLLMELELIEPSLSISTNDNACSNFYIALLEVLVNRNIHNIRM